jgi:hypothetical protein
MRLFVPHTYQPDGRALSRYNQGDPDPDMCKVKAAFIFKMSIDLKPC